MRHRLTRILLYTLALATVAGVGGLLWHLREQRILFYSDADSIRRPVDEALTRDVLWTPPVEVDGAVNSPADEYGPRVTHDGLVMYLVRREAGGDTDIHISTRGPNGWSDPAPFDVLNTAADELGPEPSRDGRSLYFASNRAGGAGGYDLWVVHRDDALESGWGAPVNLGAGVNTPYHEYGPAVTAAGDTIWFASNRPGAGEAELPGASESVVVREDQYRGDFDLYSAAMSGGTPSQARPALTLNSIRHDSAPALSPTGDFLYFSSDREGGLGGFDIYRVRLTPSIALPSNLGDPVNTRADEIDPGVSIAGFGLHFSSDRRTAAVATPDEALADGAADVDVDHELYFAASREVYTATEVFRASIDWLAILPYALWIVIAILLMLMVWSLSRALSSERYRALNLIAKCLIASLLVHALLLVGLAFWGVGNTVSEWASSRGTRVAIVSPSVGSDLAAQIRGTMTDVAMDAQVVAAEQTESEVAPPRGERAPTELTVAHTSIDTSEPAPATVANAAPAPTAALPETVEPAKVQPVSGSTLALEMESSPAPTASAETSIEIPTDVPGAEPLAFATPSTPVNPVVSNPAPSRAASIAGSETIVENSVVRDARPAARHAAVQSSARPTIVAPRAGIVTDLPVVPEASVQRTGEAEQVAASTAATTSTPRARQPIRGPERSTSASRIDIAPVDGQTTPEQTSLAREAGTAAMARDALPTMSKPASGVAQTRRPVLPPLGPASALAFDLPSADADVPPPAVESVVLVDAGNTMTPIAQRATSVNPDAASTAAVVLADPAASMVNSALAAHLESAVPAMLALDAPPAIDLSPLEVRRLPVAPRRELALDVPIEQIFAPSPQRQRAPEARMKIVKEMGGNEETERAVAMSLDWLARHQSLDGRWDSDGYDDNCHACSGSTRIEVDIAVTSLAMLCFLATDNTHLKEGQYQDAMARALHWLRRQQGADGNLLGTESMYSHGIATIALSEAYGMTGDPALKQPVEDAVNFIVAARNRRGGGWRYAPGQAGDTSVLGWQIMAMKSAAGAGVEVDPAGFASVRRWMESIQRMAPAGLYIYQPGRPHSPAMTAEGLFVQQLLGSDPDLTDMDASVEYILSNLPSWEQEANTYYWYYGTLALFQHQGDAWRRWNAHVKEQLLEHQIVTGRAAGSWDPADQWSRTGGRIYQTAICTLTLEVYYRYLPRFIQTVNRE